MALNKTFITMQMHIADRRYEQYKLYIHADQLVYEAMSAMGFNVNQYCIGGSVALIAYNVDINRTPHDVDVIVPKGFANIISHFVSCDKFNRFRFKPNRSSQSSYSFQYKDIVIDILEEDEINVYDVVQRNCRLNCLEDIMKIKEKWLRPKDLEDLTAISMVY
jgi:hypothetical protein